MHGTAFWSGKGLNIPETPSDMSNIFGSYDLYSFNQPIGVELSQGVRVISKVSNPIPNEMKVWAHCCGFKRVAMILHTAIRTPSH